jgi:hypothetical protein
VHVLLDIILLPIHTSVFRNQFEGNIFKYWNSLNFQWDVNKKNTRLWNHVL